MTERSKSNNLLSKRGEETLVEAGRQLLLKGGYPNPERVGCPGAEVLEAIAFRKMPLREAVDYIDHMGYCSPCFIEYTAFRKQAQRRKTLELAFASVALVVAIVGGIWLWKVYRSHGTGGKPNVPTVMAYEKLTVDLRNWFVPRGEEQANPNAGPIHLPRGRLDLTILLPAESKPGNYEVQVSVETGKPIVKAEGVAVIQNGITVLQVKLDTSIVSRESCVLSIMKPGTERRDYPLAVK